MKVLLSESSEEAAERVRKRDGDRSITATVDRLVADADRGMCLRERGDMRVCGAPITIGCTCCKGCAGTAPKRARKGAKS